MMPRHLPTRVCFAAPPPEFSDLALNLTTHSSSNRATEERRGKHRSNNLVGTTLVNPTFIESCRNQHL